MFNTKDGKMKRYSDLYGINSYYKMMFMHISEHRVTNNTK
jgi:hypothetical protein